MSRSLVDSTAENKRNSIKQFILAELLKSHSPSLKAVKDACVRELVAANTTARVIFFGSIVKAADNAVLSSKIGRSIKNQEGYMYKEV